MVNTGVVKALVQFCSQQIEEANIEHPRRVDVLEDVTESFAHITGSTLLYAVSNEDEFGISNDISPPGTNNSTFLHVRGGIMQENPESILLELLKTSTNAKVCSKNDVSSSYMQSSNYYPFIFFSFLVSGSSQYSTCLGQFVREYSLCL